MIPEITNKDATLLKFSSFDTPLPGNSKFYKIAACVIPLLGLVISTRIFLSVKKRISLIKPDNVLDVTSNNIIKQFKSRSRQEIKTYLKSCLINLFIISAVVACFLVPQLTAHIVVICIAILLIKAFLVFISKINKHIGYEKIIEESKAVKDQLNFYGECLDKQGDDLLEISNSCTSLSNSITDLYNSCQSTGLSITEEEHEKLQILMSDITKILGLTKNYPGLTDHPKTCTKDIKMVTDQRSDHHTESVIAIKAALADTRNRFTEVSNRLSEAQKKLQHPPV